jgi:hypothetical protein
MIGAPLVGGLVGVCLGYVGGYVAASLLPNIDDFGVVAFFYGSIFACIGLVFGPLLARRFWPREVLGKAAVQQAVEALVGSASKKNRD